jgi:hypothetical protein
LLVWLITHEAAHYLIPTGQMLGPNTEEICDAFADTMLSEMREGKEG